MSKKLLVVFDIDETLIHFMAKKYTNLFYDLPEDIQEKFNYKDFGGSLILFRPYLKQLFEYYKNADNIDVGLWTYSEREYAYDIKDVLTEELDLPEDFFLFAFGAEDMINEDGDEDDYPKNLQKIYREFPDYNMFNTFIVDDAPGNIKHEINMQNCLLIQPFAPFSVDKVRKDTGESGIENALNDDILEFVEDISKKVLSDIDGCSIEDIEECFDSEPVFSKNRIKRMGLTKLLKKYVKPPCLNWQSEYDLLTIGEPKTSKKFMMIDGGSRKKIKKTIKKSNKNSKKKNKVVKKTFKLKKGTFTKMAKNNGYSNVQKFATDIMKHKNKNKLPNGKKISKLMIKRANFVVNSRKFKKK